jgi:hypothetical protein
MTAKLHGVKSLKVTAVQFILRETVIYLTAFHDNNTIKRFESVECIKHRLYLVRDSCM